MFLNNENFLDYSTAETIHKLKPKLHTLIQYKKLEELNLDSRYNNTI